MELAPLDRDDPTPLSAQLVEALRTAMLEGRLRGGDRMPSSRALARQLGVSRGVVVAAFDQLAGEGYLHARPGAVAEVAALPDSSGEDALYEAAIARPDRPRIDLTPGRPSTRRIDERAWRSAWRAAAEPLTPEIPAGTGELALREQLADHLRHARGIACTADDLVVTGGTSEAVALLALALRGIHRAPRVAVEDPGYAAARRVLEAVGVRTVPVAVDEDGIRLAALEDAPADAVMLTPSHQYPLGGRLPAPARLAVLEWAERHDALVIEDDYDSEFRHAGATLPALRSLDHGERVALVGSLSKVLAPGVRVGWIVLPREQRLRAAVAAIRRDLTCPVPIPVQHALAHFLASGALRRHIARIRRDYTHRRDLVQAALGDLPGLRGLDGGLHAVLELPDAAAEQGTVAWLADRGIAVAPLSDYAARPEPSRHGIVFGYAAPSDLALDECLRAIREALRQGLVAARTGQRSEAASPHHAGSRP